MNVSSCICIALLSQFRSDRQETYRTVTGRGCSGQLSTFEEGDNVRQFPFICNFFVFFMERLI